MHVHLVFVTQCRPEVFTQDTLDERRGTFASVCSDFEAQLVEFNDKGDQTIDG